MFENQSVNHGILERYAYNLRWAAVESGTIPLTAADPDFPCAPQISEAVQKWAKDSYFCYGPPEGLPDFRVQMARFFDEKRGIAAVESRVLAVDSAAYGIYLVCKTLLTAGDEAIIFDPVDFLFRYSIETVGATAVTYPIPAGTETETWEGLEAKITPRTRLICLCNPLNPTGKVFTESELTQLADIAVKHNLTILSDEIWSDIVFKPHVYTSIASLDHAVAQLTITVTGFSKSYGLAGLRIGALHAPSDAMFSKLFAASLHQSTVHGINTAGQIAATAALSGAQDWLAAFIIHLQKMRDICTSELNTIKGFKCIPPQGCYVAFANITGTGLSSTEVAERIRKEGKVAIVPGLKQWFGEKAEGYIRLSFATSEAILSDALLRIKNCFE